MQPERSEIVEWSSRRRTHQLRSRLNRPSLQVDGKGLALEKMHSGTCHLEVLASVNQTFAFGRVESGDKALSANERVAVSVEREMAANGNGNGDLRGDEDGEDSTMSGGTISSARTKAT